jgi:hypothetical protein
VATTPARCTCNVMSDGRGGRSRSESGGELRPHSPCGAPPRPSIWRAPSGPSATASRACARRSRASGGVARRCAAPTPCSLPSYNRPESDFDERAAYDDYLEAREDIS